jgi:hypothetical protein
VALLARPLHVPIETWPIKIHRTGGGECGTRRESCGGTAVLPQASSRW